MIKPGESWPFDLTRPSEPGEETYGRDDDPSRMPARLRDLTGKQQTMIRAYVAGRAGALDVWMHLPSAEAARIRGLIEALARRELDALIAPYDPAMIRAVDAEDEREPSDARAAAPLGFIVKDKCGFQVFGGRVFDSYERAQAFAEAANGADRVRMYFDIVERSPV